MASKNKVKYGQKQWADENMVSAMKAVADKKMTINVAATKFSLPRKTLDDRIKGRVQHGNTPGVDIVLTAEEEAGLESYLLHLAGCGFSLTRTMVLGSSHSLSGDIVTSRLDDEREGCEPRR